MHLSPPPPPPGGFGCCPFWGGGSVVVGFLFVVVPILGSVIVLCFVVCCFMSVLVMGWGELIALLNLSSWCLVVVGRLFLAVPRGCLRFVIVVFPDHTHLLFLLN